MPRTLPAIAVFAVIAAGCSAAEVAAGTTETVAPTSSVVTATTVPNSAEAGASTSAPESTTTTTAEPAPEVVVDGPPAPDFALALDDGRGFILSQEEKPVYMVFWAEW